MGGALVAEVIAAFPRARVMEALPPISEAERKGGVRWLRAGQVFSLRLSSRDQSSTRRPVEPSLAGFADLVTDIIKGAHVDGVE
jgi:hypothetical protein